MNITTIRVTFFSFILFNIQLDAPNLHQMTISWVHALTLYVVVGCCEALPVPAVSTLDNSTIRENRGTSASINRSVPVFIYFTIYRSGLSFPTLPLLSRSHSLHIHLKLALVVTKRERKTSFFICMSLCVFVDYSSWQNQNVRPR